MKFYHLAILCISFLLFISCSSVIDPENHQDDSLDNVSIYLLKNAPSNLNVDGLELNFESFLWRDFMPSSPPDGKPLIAKVEITAKNGSPLPEKLESDLIWVIYENQVWGTRYSETQFEHDPTRLVKVARNGPKFGPGKDAIVVIRIIYGEDSFLLRKSGQEIIQTW